MVDLADILAGCGDFGRLLDNFRREPKALSGRLRGVTAGLASWLSRSAAGVVDLVQQADQLAEGAGQLFLEHLWRRADSLNVATGCW